jgi:sulfhydrogenase subunit beta (sulfur reductase)
MEVLKISNENWKRLIQNLIDDFEFIAPAKKGISKFQHIKNPDEIFLEKQAYFPVKEFFFQKHQVLFKFKGNDIEVPKLESPTRIFFALRRCDLNAIKHQDNVFMEQVKDPYYTALRQNAILVGYHCNEAPSKYCFCGTLKLEDFHDLMFFDKKTHFLVEIGSDKGRKIIDKYKKYFEKTKIIIADAEKKIPGADRLLKDDISKYYDNPNWQKGVNQCLSCAACTNLCPTCYCFEIHDETKSKDVTAGERKRQWSSCQLQDFTKVAGEHVFRQKREERFKHRIYHQLQYFKEKNKINLCVGCGRCIEGCPTRIDFVQIINEMK